MNLSSPFHKDRISTIFLKCGELSVKNDSLLFTGNNGDCAIIPVTQFSVICLEHGTTVTHDAVALCSKYSCMINWVGENAVRLSST